MSMRCLFPHANCFYERGPFVISSWRLAAAFHPRDARTHARKRAATRALTRKPPHVMSGYYTCFAGVPRPGRRASAFLPTNSATALKGQV